MNKTLFASMVILFLLGFGGTSRALAATTTDTVSIMVMKHVCPSDIHTTTDWGNIGDVAAREVKCPVIVKPGDNFLADTIHGTKQHFEFVLQYRNASGAIVTANQTATFTASKKCETDIDRDINGDGKKDAATCLDTSYYTWSGIPKTDVTLTEMAGGQQIPFAGVQFTPGSGDDASLISAGDGIINLNARNDSDGQIMLHVHNFAGALGSDTSGSGVGTSSGELMTLVDRINDLLARIENLQKELRDRVSELRAKIGNIGGGTTPPPPPSPLSLSGVTATSTSTSSADISWATNRPATSNVYYGTQTPLDPMATGTKKESNASMTSAHGMHLSGLSANTTYYFILSGMDASGFHATSSQGSFMTPAQATSTQPTTTPPVITSLTATSTGSTTGMVSWTTDKSASTRVYYGTTSPVNISSATSSAGTTVIDNPSLVTNHSVNLSGLLPNTMYHLVAESSQGGMKATSTEISFTTLSGTTTGTSSATTTLAISGLSASGIGSTTARISWNTNSAADSTVYYSTSTPVATSSPSTHVVASSTPMLAHVVNLSGLNSNTTYYGVAASRDPTTAVSTTSNQFLFTTLP